MRSSTLVAGAALVVSAVLLSSCTQKQVQESSSSSSVKSVMKAGPQPDWSTMTGALVQVSMQSTVGVVLDDIPDEHRGAYVDTVMNKPFAYWNDLARKQIRLTSLRLSYRNLKGKKQLPLPPEELWKIQLQGTPARATIDGHDVITLPFTFKGTLLSDPASVAASEPALAKIGGAWTEHFVFPVDPEFIFQRTGFACMNESEFPPNSMDAEESDLFYDDRCTVEKKLSNTGCHQTQLPKQSCVTAVKANIGAIQSDVVFTRLAWDQKTADSVRRGTATNLTGPDLLPYKEEFMKNRNTYRYVAADSCAVEERCVTGTGWRHLLMFPTADLNAGTKPLEIGFVDYFLKKQNSVLEQHGVFELSSCHKHYHFSHYGTFSFGDLAPAITRKNGFCLQPTARLWNNELSPLSHPYTDCLDQGVAAGWIDEYRMGLDCQWLDVTGLSTAHPYPLTFETNPDGLLCEGTPKKDEDGKQVFEPTDFVTDDGKPVDRPACEYYPEWKDNNTESYNVNLLNAGESYVTEKCRDGLSGPLRNCGFTNKKQLFKCKPGSKVTIMCRIPEKSHPQMVRVCEGSQQHNVGLPCTYNEALANEIINTQRDITFTCPGARDDVETGGAFSYLGGQLFTHDPAALVDCVIK